MPQEKQVADGGYFLGFDGGGSKTDCILVNAGANVLARATAGSSNPLRAGYAKAWFALSDAADIVLERVAPRAHIVTLQEKPAEAAAKLAIRLGRRKAHAG